MNKIEIIIGDKKYNVKTDESPEYVKKVETILNEQINIIGNSNKRFNDIDRLILSSFIIAEKYIRSVNEIKEFRNQIEKEIQTLKENQDKAIKENEETKTRYESLNIEKEKYREKLLAKDSDREYLNAQISKQQERINEQEQQLLKSEILINELKDKNEELFERCDNFSKERENFTKELSYINNTKSSLNGRISKLQLKLNEKDQLVSQLEKSIRNLKNLNEDQSLKIDFLNDEAQKNSIVIQSKDKDIEHLNNKIATMQKKLNEKDEIILLKDTNISNLKSEHDLFLKKLDKINDEKEKYLEELLMINSDKESLNSKLNETQEKLNRRETENFQNQLEINKLKKENEELMSLMDAETSI